MKQRVTQLTVNMSEKRALTVRTSVKREVDKNFLVNGKLSCAFSNAPFSDLGKRIVYITHLQLHGVLQ